MSWFKRRPHIKEPEKTHPHRTTSPILEEIKKKAQEAGPEQPKKAKLKKE
jgi:hypothetical protein